MQKSYIVFSVLIITLSAAQYITCAKILFLLPIATKSHKNVFDPLIDELANRDHEVTVISPIKTSKLANVKEIIPLSLEEVMGSMRDGFELRREGILSFLTSLNTTNIARVCNHMYENEDVQWIMKNEKFDLIIVNGVMNHCAFGIIGHFKCPHIVLTTLPAPASLAKYFGNHFPLSVTPEPFLPFGNRMTFTERTLNLLFSTTISLVGPILWYPLMENVYKVYLPNSPSLEQINNNASLLFMNSHFTLTYPRPLLPTVVEVGGMHCRAGKPLPKDLDEFLSDAKHGFILFSLGSIVKAKNMPEETRKVFVNVFGRLSKSGIRVIWKWETESMPDLPANVKLSKWLPQQDILAHKNIRAFITHGGLLSTQEAVYHGVPLIGLPIFADQDLNMGQAEKAGYSLTLEILELTEEKLESALDQILNQPSFGEKAQGLSKVFRDQPETPLERAVFWSEYVIRNGAAHMQTSAKDLNFLQYHSIDSILFLTSILFTILLILKYILWNILVRRVILSSLGFGKKRVVDLSKKRK